VNRLQLVGTLNGPEVYLESLSDGTWKRVAILQKGRQDCCSCGEKRSGVFYDDGAAMTFECLRCIEARTSQKKPPASVGRESLRYRWGYFLGQRVGITRDERRTLRCRFWRVVKRITYPFLG